MRVPSASDLPLSARHWESALKAPHLALDRAVLSRGGRPPPPGHRFALDLRQTAINDHFSAGDIGAVRAREEQNGPSDFLGTPKATQRNPGDGGICESLYR